MWRLREFARTWWPLFVQGKTRAEKIIKWIGLSIALLGLPGVWSISLLLPGPTPHAFKIKIVTITGLIFAAAWAVFIAGRAYELSEVPELEVGTKLEFDARLQRYRLYLLSKHKEVDVRVYLTDIVDASGESLIPARFPMEAEWSNHADETVIHLRKNIKESVSIAGRFGKDSLMYTGARHKDEIKLNPGQKVYFRLQIEYPKHDMVERSFSFEFVDENTPIKVLCERPPAVVMSKGTTSASLT